MRPHVLEEGAGKLDKKNFVGLPIPPAAGLLAAIVHYAPSPLNTYGSGYARYYTILIYILLAILGGLMVSKIRYSSFKSAGALKITFPVVVLIAAGGMVMWFYSQYALLVFAVIYVGHGIVGWLYRSVTGRRSETAPAPTEAESL